MFFVFLCILYEETVPYRTVLQYYSYSLPFWNCYRSFIIYIIYIIYIIKSFCNPQTKTVILYVRTLGLSTG